MNILNAIYDSLGDIVFKLCRVNQVKINTYILYLNVMEWNHYLDTRPYLPPVMTVAQVSAMASVNSKTQPTVYQSGLITLSSHLCHVKTLTFGLICFETRACQTRLLPTHTFRKHVSLGKEIDQLAHCTFNGLIFSIYTRFDIQNIR